jgi:hypothetical protein
MKGAWDGVFCEGCMEDVGECECEYCDKCNENIDLGDCYCDEVGR